jgi:hypothetical protein
VRKVYASENIVTVPPGSPSPETSYLGIDRGNDGVTPNYTGVPSNTPPGVQNHPDLSTAVSAGVTTVSGTLNSFIDTSFKVEFFSNTVGPNFRAGEKFLGSLVVTTNSSGHASFNFSPQVLVPAGQFVTSTATQLDAELHPIDTSEFSAPIIVNPTRGDYNANGTVDAADYVLWRNTRGQAVAPFAGADGSGNGLVDQADHDFWRANFGKTWSPAGASAAVLEPTAEGEQAQSITTTASSTPSPDGTHPNRAESTAAPRRAFAPSPREGMPRVAPRPALTMGTALLTAATPNDAALTAWLTGNAPLRSAVNRELLDSPAIPSHSFSFDDEVTASIDSNLDGLDGAFESIGQERGS